VKCVIRFDVQKNCRRIWCGTRLVLRFDEFDESDEMLDERTLSCMDIELLMASI
jgi:hypothetical protein